MTTNTHTTLAGHAITYEAGPELAAFFKRLHKLAEDPAVTEDQLVAAVYGRDNPLLDHDAIPGRGAVTAEVLAHPAYRVMTDLLFRKHVAERGVDLAKLAARYTLTAAEAAERLGVSKSAVQQAIESGRLGSWLKEGRHHIDPQALASFRSAKLAPRGPAPVLEVRTGTIEGRSLHVKHPGTLRPLGRTPDGDRVTIDRADGTKYTTGEISSWRRVGVLTGGGGKVRFVVLEPAHGAPDDPIDWGGLYVHGRFRVVEKINNTKRAKEAWQAFQPA